MKHRTFTPPEVRRLNLEFLHHPRHWEGPEGEWEIHRGFRIRVMTRNVMALFLGQPPSYCNLLSLYPEPGEDSFMVLPAPLNPQGSDLAMGLGLASEEGWVPQVTLILSDDRQLTRPYRALKRELKSAIPREHEGLVLWVLQEMPGELCEGMDFFNPEQTLHQLGRIGRRVGRRGRWRRFLP